MRILTQSAYLDPVGGIELSTYQDVLALSRRGHNFDLFYGANGRMGELYELAGVRLHGPTDFNFNPRRPVREMRKHLHDARQARSFTSDVLWLRRFEHIVWGQTVARASRIPIVCHLHHMPMFRYAGARGVGVRHYIAVSEFLKREWSKVGIAPNRITVVHNALPEGQYPRGGGAERASARAQLGLPPDAPTVLYYGRLTSDKGVVTLLDAWRTVRTRHRDARLLLVGKTPAREVSLLSGRLEDLAGSGIITFELQDDVVPFLHASDLVVFPTLMEEGFGRVAIEALATGRPVIASRIGALPEILFGELDRFLVEPGNSGDLAEKIVENLGWRDFDPGLEAKCADWVSRNFPYASHLEHIERILQNHARQSRSGD